MTTDLTMLTASGILAALLIVPYGLAMWALWPIREILGNRAGPSPALPRWAERAQRAQRNMLENLPHFAVFVLVAHVAGLANAQTALGASIFFWARLAHAVAYVAGLWQLRAPAFFAGLAGECLIIMRLLGWTPGGTAVGIAALAIAFASTVLVLRRLAAPMHSGREGVSA
jgi:uncharacterized MAPEG superfamily protein